jgi:PPK2 family polyphosphate:nucleotide phosphotransferase
MSKDRGTIVDPHRVEDGSRFQLSAHDPDDTSGASRDRAEKWLAADLEDLAKLQAKLFALNRWSVLLIFQGMDASGKDGVIRHVMSGLNPQGSQVFSFKAPSDEELDHDFLWRCARCLPERGRIGIWNRSWYEEVLIVRVRPDVFATQRLPERLITKHIWEEREEDIVAFERHLARNGTLVLKFFLHVSPEEQKQRLLARIDEAEKNWKFNPGDLGERKRWKQYMDAYEDMVKKTAAPHAPWIVVPADAKWYARLVVAAAVVDALQALDLAFPTLSPEQKRELKLARKELAE